MRSFLTVLMALCAVVITAQAPRAETCTPVVDGAAYCSDIAPRKSAIAQLYYPDLVTTYTIQQKPFVTTAVIAMPYDRPIKHEDDLIRMMIHQMMDMGQSPTYKIPQIEVDTYTGFDGKLVERAWFSGQESKGGIMGRFVADVIPMQEAALILITTSEGYKPIEADALMELHTDSVARLRPTP